MTTRTIITCATHGRIKAADRPACEAAGCRLTERTERLRRQRQTGLIKDKRCRCPKDAKPTCEHSWFFQRTHKGTQYRFAIDERAGKHIASKSDAEDLAADYWREIKAGKFATKTEPESAPASMTLAKLFELHFAKRKRSKNDQSNRSTILRTSLPCLDGVNRPLGEWIVAPFMSITPEDVERFKEVRLAEHVEAQTKRNEAARARVAEALQELRAKPTLSNREGRRLAYLEHEEAEVARRTVSDGKRSVNRCLQLWRAVQNWGIVHKKTFATPFTAKAQDGSVVPAVTLFKERPRRRRFEADERERLLAACRRGEKGGTDLRAFVETMLDTCCRPGELLSLQWFQVDWDRNEIFLPGDKTKSGKLRRDDSGERWIPMTQRVRALLDMRKLDLNGQEWPADKYVFGNAAGEPITSVKTAWKLACRRAGIVGLQLRDLRREAASTLLEGHAPDHAVKDILGHANIRTTSTYLATTRRGLHEVMRRFEAQREKDAHEDAHAADQLVLAGSTDARKSL